MSPPDQAARGSCPAVPARLLAAPRAVVDLLLPVACAGCGEWDETLCRRCEALLRTPLRRCEDDGAAGLVPAAAQPTWRVADYAGAVRGIVLAWKRGADRGVAAAVARAARAAGSAWYTELAAAGAPVAGDLVVVPAPSGWRRRAAGLLVVRDLATDVAAGLRDGRLATTAGRHATTAGRNATVQVGERAGGDPPARVGVADVLRRGGGTASQRGLGASARAANRRRSMRLVAGLAPGSSCLLVDDVMTTGATLAQARRTLEAAGHGVLGALVLAATPAPRRR